MANRVPDHGSTEREPAGGIQRRTRRHASAWILLAFSLLPGCSCGEDGKPCTRDGDCGLEAVCYVDNRCLPRTTAARLGAMIGDECVTASVGGNVEEIGCSGDAICRLGHCAGAPVDGGPADSEPPDGRHDPDMDAGSDAAPPAMSCTEGTPADGAPLFGGVTEAVPDGADAVVLRWINAADETPPEAMTYLVFVSAAMGAEDFSTAAATVVGQTSYRVSGLTTGTTYYFVVRAQDEAGQAECNTSEASATPAMPPDCADFATMVQPIFEANCIRCHSGPMAPRNLHLDSYDGVMTGGLTGNEIVACQSAESLLYMKISSAMPPVGMRMPLGGPYLLDAQIDTIRRWIDGGAQRSCPGTAGACDDSVPPSFAGVMRATLSADAASAEVCWDAATDDVTAPAEIVYDVYQGTGPGAQDYGRPPRTTTPGGATCVTLDGLTPGEHYCWVVRARDEVGNRDGNTIERCVTVPAAACADFATVIQPIFTASCVRCHSGPLAPRGLHLDSFDGVRAGGMTGNEVVACRPADSLLYLKISQDMPPVGRRMPLDGPPYLTAAEIDAIGQWITEGARTSCAAPDPCTDVNPPSFSGITTATMEDATSARLCWSAGTDDVTTPGDLVYDVYQGSSAASVDTSRPATTSPAGAACVTVGSLSPGAQYCWMVRARDGAGNRDTNTVVQCVTVPAATCVDYSTVVRPVLQSRCVICHSGPTAPRGLHLDSYAGVRAGGMTGSEVVACRETDSLLYLKISLDTPPVGVRMPFGGPYLSAAEIATIGQWIREGAKDTCADPDPCSDSIAPAFGGLTSASATNATTARLCWSAGMDNLTPTANLLYDVYQATTPGGETFTAPAQLTSAAGATCVDVDALSPGGTYCWVARARDGAGNRDTNTVERCSTLPALPPGCVDYATMIQPLLDHNCTRCHGGATPPQWLRLDTYDDVLAGSVRRNEVVPCDAAASLMLGKVSATPPFGRRMPFDGPPYLADAQIAMLGQWITNGARRSCAEASTCGERVRPTFAGVTSATPVDATTIHVCWSAATDDAAPAASIRYDLFQSTSPGGEAFGEPAPTTVTGATCTDVRVGPGTTMCFVVRSRDLVGNQDANTVERCVTTPAAACAVDFATLIQPIFSARCTHCHRPSNPPRFLDLTSYSGALAAGALRNEVLACDWAGSLLNRKSTGAVCGRRMPFDGPPYLAPSERSLLQAWIESGARLTCTEPATCGDTAPPSFTGITRVREIDPTTAEVCWDPATDDLSPASGITYLVYESATAGGERFASPASYASPAGSTCIRIPVPAGQSMCWVVRARDVRGNRESNSVERCLSTAAACVDYATRVQPTFDARCIQCHIGSSAPNGIRWDTYARAIADRDEVRPCDGRGSKLIDATSRCFMPYDTSADRCSTVACLTPAQQALLREWIDQGASASCPAGGCP